MESDQTLISMSDKDDFDCQDQLGTYSKNVYFDTSIELRDENPNMICVWDFLFFQCSIVEFHVTSDANEELKSCNRFVSITAFRFASLLF